MKIVIAGKAFDVADDVIQKALEDKKDSIDIASDNIVIRDQSEEETFVNNLKSEAKTAGIEIAIKEARTSLGLDFQGKTMENLLDAYKSKVIADASIEPAEQVKNLTKDIDILKTTISTLESEKATIETQFNGFKNETVLNGTLSSLMPSNTVIPKDDLLMIMRNRIKFNVNESGQVVALDQAGEVRKDGKTLSPIAVKDVVQEFFDQNPSYLSGPQGGQGGKDHGGGTGGTMKIEDYVAKAEQNGVNTNTPEFMAEVRKKVEAKELS